MGIYPKIDSSFDIIENCSKCYVASLRCADPDVGDVDRFDYKKDENHYYCIKTKSKFSHNTNYIWILFFINKLPPQLIFCS